MNNLVAYVTTNKEFPVTNHLVGLDKGNLGWCRGVTIKGDPFEAELWVCDKVKAMTILLPIRKPLEKENKKSTLTSYHYTDFCKTGSILDIGMVFEGDEEDLEVIQDYVEYIKDMEMIIFTGELENGSVQYVTDVMGNTFACVTIDLEDCGKEEAECFLEFKPFNNYHKREHKGFKAVSGGI